MNLLKGQKIKIQDLTPSARIELHTSVRMRSGEVDVTCFGVDGKGKLSDDRYFIFYNQMSSPEQAITMRNDGTGSVFSIDLNRLPASVKKLVITAAADDSAAMKDVDSGRLALVSGGQELAEFNFSGGQFQQEKAVILCEIYEKDGIWRLSVVASGFNGGLSALLKYFGGEEVSPGARPPVAPVPPVNPGPSGRSVPPVSPGQSERPGQSGRSVPPVNPGPLGKRTPPAPLPSSRQVPPPSPVPAPMKAVSLKKSGDSHKISLKKNNQEIHVNLNWNMKVSKGLFGFGSSAIDLDLACMYKLKTGEMGVIQALGNSFGNASNPPYIFLDQDDRSGVSKEGENMWFKRPELVDFAIVFAYIYEGVANWKETDASVVLKQHGAPDIEIHLDNCISQERFCVIASMTARGEELEVRREERFFKSHPDVDRAYGFGFRWKAGRK